MGEVWLGQDRLADRKVALKFIKPHLLADPGFRNRFSNEAKTLGKLEHDRIVTLYSVLDEGEYLALILRFIDGISLADKIDSQGALPLDFVLSCAGDILPALGFAHENGIIHRDIKPPNILVDSRNRSFLMDFGIAVAAFAERGTMTGLAIGTPHYMSPEQIRTPQAIRPETGGHRTDIYSFGVVLFEMLSGRVPFGLDSGVEDIFTVQSAHCNEPPPPLREINANVSPGIEAAVMACLEKDPANRPQTCMELLQELERAAQGGGQSVPLRTATVVEARSAPLVSPVQSVSSSASPIPFKRKTPQGVWYGLGAVGIAAGIGFAVLNHGEKPVDNPVSSPAITQVPDRGNTKATVRPTPTPGLVGSRQPPNVNGPVSPTPTPAPPPQQPSGPTPEQVAAAQKAQKAEEYFQTGKRLSEQGDDCGAETPLKKAIGLDPKNPEYTSYMQTAVKGCSNVAQ
jgi:serine/threonine-protein kinase